MGTTEGAKKGWTPERRERQRQLMLGHWADPANRAEQAATIKEAWDRDDERRRTQGAKVAAALSGRSKMTREDWNAYQRRHGVIRRRKGKAAAYICVECQGQAEQWAQITGTSGMSWRHYQPMCRPCHVAYDTAARRLRQAGGDANDKG